MIHRLVAPLLLLPLLAACSGDDEPRPRDTDTTPTETGTAPPPPETAHTGTTETGSTGVTGDTGPATVEVDCSLVPASPVSTKAIVGARAYHDVIFDTAGNVIGSDGVSDSSNLVWADYYGNSGILVPGTGRVQGLGRLLDGDFVGATDTTQSLFRFTSAGAFSNIVGNSGAYGVIVGPDGMVYTANYDVVERIDPATGTRTELVSPSAFQPKSINWNKDYTKLYMATGSGNGNVYAVDIDPVTLDPLAAPYVFATDVGSGTYHDCLTVDYCDNVYVCDYNTQRMYRITPAGQVSVYIDFPNGMYAHGAEWGSGINGFRVDALYVAQPYNGYSIAEIVVGIPGRDWDGTGWTQ